MKYVFLVSHGTFAPGLHNALSMLAGGGREDIISTSLENGMSTEVYAENVRKCIAGITEDDEIILFGDIVGGSPLTTAANIIAEKNLMPKTIMIGGVNLPLALSAVLSKDDMGMKDLAEMLIPEAQEQIKQFEVAVDNSEEEI